MSEEALLIVEERIEVKVREKRKGRINPIECRVLENSPEI